MGDYIKYSMLRTPQPQEEDRNRRCINNLIEEYNYNLLCKTLEGLACTVTNNDDESETNGNEYSVTVYFQDGKWFVLKLKRNIFGYSLSIPDGFYGCIDITGLTEQGLRMQDVYQYQYKSLEELAVRLRQLICSQR
jgi:hypothetical protein